MNIKAYIRDIPDFPEKGIMFKDITPLLACPAAMEYVIHQFAQIFTLHTPTAICGIESRGFIFGSLLAQAMHLPFHMIRKQGKLPGDLITKDYDLEYGTATLEIQKTSFQKTDRVLIVDDVLATGGTLVAATNLVKQSGAIIIGIGCLIELGFLAGRKKLANQNVYSIIEY